MSDYGRNSGLAKFIMGQSGGYNAVSEAVEKCAWRNKRELEFLDSPGVFIELAGIDFKRALNITIDGGIVEFDAAVEGSFTWQTRQSRRHDFNGETGCQWFGLHCVMEITDKLENFKVARTEIYSNERKKDLPNPATADFVPVIYKKDFDGEATKFLKKWYPQALKEPIRLPIREIAERMGLKVITDVPLTKDLSVFGQICFADCEIDTY
ncbi:MAG: hypothetical protein LBL66_05200, partial [Clostridiales bacterium]|nr:hypothetical protein [Clostridiales bacterium]